MRRLFRILMLLYPPQFRAEFEPEMHSVFFAVLATASRHSFRQWAWVLWTELIGTLTGAVREQAPRATPALAGATMAFCLHAALYTVLVPIRTLLLLGLLVGSLPAQPPAQQDPTILQTAKSLYTAALTAIRDAKSLDDMKKLADQFDSPDWISVDRFGRPGFTRRQADTGLAALLALPADRRITGMEILWAERDSDRMIVLGWMMPNQVERPNPTGGTQRLTRSTLFRDTFTDTPLGWRRIKHEKLLPNDFTLVIDGLSQIIPPLDERHRVSPTGTVK